MFSRPILVLLVVSAVAAPALAGEGKADGTLTANGKTVKLTHAYATRKPNPFDKKLTDAYVVFTDRAMPAEKATDTFGLMEAEGINAVTVEITPDKSVVSGELYSPSFKKMHQFSAVGMQKLDITTMTKDRIAGRVYIEKMQDFFDEKYTYDIRFDVPLAAGATSSATPPAGASAAPPAPAASGASQAKGKPLPAGGGEPGKAYMAYQKVLMSGDLAALRKSVGDEQAKQMNDPDFPKMLKLVQAMQPKNIRITGGTSDGTTATLNATGKDGDATSTGTITMALQGGVWKVTKESWSQ